MKQEHRGREAQESPGFSRGEEVNTFFAQGVPVAQGSKNAFVRGGKVALVESSKALPKWRETVTQAAILAHGGEPLDGAVEISLEFVMPRPKAWGKNRQDPMIQRPDMDKLIRAVLDAITGVVVHDDSQFTRIEAFKRRAAPGEPTGVYAESRDAGMQNVHKGQEESEE